MGASAPLSGLNDIFQIIYSFVAGEEKKQGICNYTITSRYSSSCQAAETQVQHILN